MTSALRIVIGEDGVLFREGLVRVLNELGHTVVAAVGDANAVTDAVRAHEPDLAIIDVRMPPEQESDGTRAAAAIKAEKPAAAVLLLSQHIELRHCLHLIGTPGFGYLLKDRVLDLADFDDALRRVAAGGVALDPHIVQALVQATRTPKLSMLSERERSVLDLVAEGRSNTSISTILRIAERTVESHMRSIFTKLDLSDDGATHRRVRAVVLYLESGPT